MAIAQNPQNPQQPLPIPQFTIPNVDVEVKIDGTKYDFMSLVLNQALGEHHDFEIQIDHKTIDQTFFKDPEDRLTLIYKPVSFELKNDGNNAEVYIFSGMITDVKIVAERGDNGIVFILGKSVTYQMEDGESMRTFSDTTIKEIVEELTDGKEYLQAIVNPEWKDTIDFAIQYAESSWRFVQRTCFAHKEKFYFTGTHLVVGDPPNPNPTPDKKLTYEHEITKLEVCSRLLANRKKYHIYDILHDNKFPDNTMIPQGSQTINYLSKIIERSAKFAPEASPETVEFIPGMHTLLTHSDKEREIRNAKMFYIRGEARTCDIFIGRKIEITINNIGLGTYRVCKVTHTKINKGNYHCVFEAIPADLKHFPTPDIPLPAIRPLLARVYQNDDPEGQGRVRVTFSFDSADCKTWIPTMRFDAGGDTDQNSGFVSKNRGAIFIPEKNDLCIIFFMDGLRNPFVMGSMFYGKVAASQGGGKGNYIKSITTKSGIQIVMNDKDRSVRIEDPSRNTILMDGRGNISINAPKSVIITSEQIQLNSGTIELNSTKDLLISVGNNLIQSVLNIYHSTTTSFKQVTKKLIETYAENFLVKTTKSIKAQTKSAEILGQDDVVVYSDKKAEILSNNKINIHGSNQVNIAQTPPTLTLTPEPIALAIVTFKKKSSYKGEFGFDWFREYNQLQGGYDKTPDEAKNSFINEYRPIPIVDRKETRYKDKREDRSYYVPFLNLFPEAVAQASTATFKPPFKAELKIDLDELEPIDKIELEYDKNYFSTSDDIFNNSLATFKITCKDDTTANVDEMGHKEEQEIRAWAYPKGCSAKTVAEQMAERRLAGKIIVLPNDQRHRRKLKLVCVNVIIEPTPGAKTSVVNPTGNQIKHLHHTMHQLLIDLEYKPNITIDLSSDQRLQRFSGSNQKSFLTGGSIIDYNKIEPMFVYLKEQYYKANPADVDFHPIFVLDIGINAGSFVGLNRSQGKLEFLLLHGFTNEGDSVLSHEVLHGLSLDHSFQNFDPNPPNTKIAILETQKYTYQYKGTKNIMDYVDGYSTYKWQWEMTFNSFNGDE